MSRDRVLRGGSYFTEGFDPASGNLRASFRIRREPVRRNGRYGFRIVVKRRKKP